MAHYILRVLAYKRMHNFQAHISCDRHYPGIHSTLINECAYCIPSCRRKNCIPLSEDFIH